MAPKPQPAAAAVENEDACRVCGKDDDEEYLVLCDGCDRAFHTACHVGCVCCKQKPKSNFNRKPAVPEGDWFCKFCAGRLPEFGNGKAVSSVHAWGDNADGQLALSSECVWTPERLSALDGIGVVQIACGETSTLVLCNDGNVYSIGTGTSGQLGHPDIVHEKLEKFRKIDALTEEKRSKSEGPFCQIGCGQDFSIAVTTGGHVYSWGNGDVGQLGHQENKVKKAPKKISALRELEIPIDLAQCGRDFVLMVSKEGNDSDQFNTQKPGVLMAMGGNTHGQLGDGSGRNQWVPQQLNKDGPSHTSNANKDVEEPTECLLGRDIRLIAAGRGHAAAVTAGSKGLWTWGFGENGQIGHPKPEIPAGQSRFFRTQFRVLRPRFVKALASESITQVACGDNFTLMLLNDGRVMGMGDNVNGQIGVKRDADAEVNRCVMPTQVGPFDGSISVKQLGCGYEFAAALTSDGKVYTWGSGDLGQLGLGKEQKASLDKPTIVPNLPAIKKIYVGPNQVFAVEFTNETITVSKKATTSTEAPAKKKAAGKKTTAAPKKRGRESPKTKAAPSKSRKK